MIVFNTRTSSFNSLSSECVLNEKVIAMLSGLESLLADIETEETNLG
ncbi:hypothetical protein [Legionella waltersii]|nr:hypothetical protein [Legionella waltersii]SNV08339.1 Uncharacterised protein [Legionella waltersii]